MTRPKLILYGAALIGGLLFLIQSWRTHWNDGPNEPLPEVPAEGAVRSAGVGMFGGSTPPFGGSTMDAMAEGTEVTEVGEVVEPTGSAPPEVTDSEVADSNPEAPSWSGVEVQPGQDALSQALIERLEALERLRPHRSEVDLNALAAAWKPEPEPGSRGSEGSESVEGQESTDPGSGLDPDSSPDPTVSVSVERPAAQSAPEPPPAWKLFLAESTLNGVIVGPRSARALVGDRLLETGDSLFGGSLVVTWIDADSIGFESEEGTVSLELPPFRVRPRPRSGEESEGEDESPGSEEGPGEDSESATEGIPGGSSESTGGQVLPQNLPEDLPETLNELAPILESIGDGQ